MAQKIKYIGDGYDREKFISSFKLSARAMVSDSYKNPDVPTGETLQEMFMQAMEEKLKGLPTAYYQALEAIADGKSADELSSMASGRLIDIHKGAGDRRMALLLMDMGTAHTAEDFRINDPDSAQRYYDALFPERARRKITLDLTGKAREEISASVPAEPEKHEDTSTRRRVTFLGIGRKDKRERTEPTVSESTQPSRTSAQRKKDDDPIV